MSMDPKEPVRCPKCASTDVRYSYTQTTWDMILDLLFSMDAFRCRSCRHRFHKFDPGEDEEQVETRLESVQEPEPARETRPPAAPFPAAPPAHAAEPEVGLE